TAGGRRPEGRAVRRAGAGDGRQLRAMGSGDREPERGAAGADHSAQGRRIPPQRVRAGATQPAAGCAGYVRLAADVTALRVAAGVDGAAAVLDADEQRL